MPQLDRFLLRRTQAKEPGACTAPVPRKKFSGGHRLYNLLNEQGFAQFYSISSIERPQPGNAREPVVMLLTAQYRMRLQGYPDHRSMSANTVARVIWRAETAW